MKNCTKCKKSKLLLDFCNNLRSKDGLYNWCKECSSLNTNKCMRLLKENFPWKIVFNSIKQRCNNSKNNRYKYYGGRGIKCLITAEELKELWYRDKAYLMEKPSIDRENNNKHYVYSNCRFIELGKNVAERNKRVCSKIVLQFDKQNHLIKKWNSVSEASFKLNIHKSNISLCANKKAKTAGGYIWRYDNKGET